MNIHCFNIEAMIVIVIGSDEVVSNVHMKTYHDKFTMLSPRHSSEGRDWVSSICNISIPYFLYFSHYLPPSSHNISSALISGGLVRSRPVILDSWGVAMAGRTRSLLVPKGRPFSKDPLQPQVWTLELDLESGI